MISFVVGVLVGALGTVALIGRRVKNENKGDEV